MKKYNAPRVRESRGIQILTTIWLVPFIAMIIALWLGYQYYTKIGSVIKIRFKSNAGLIENQSPIKMRDVSVGLVKKISLTDDGEGVIIEARMNKEMNDYLNEKAKFWIVHPDVGSHGVSGLDTIVSGSYIELYGKKEGETIHEYVGLEQPPINDDAKGKYFVLTAPESYNLSEGSKIYYRMLEVGRVERVGISPDGTHINFTIFVEEDYIKFVNQKSKFYTRSAFNIDFSKATLDINIAPISQLVHGGISIYTPINSLDKNNTLKGNKVFTLYKNLAHLKTKQLGSDNSYITYILKFKEPTTNLQIGSPIKFQSFKIGHITDIQDRYNEKNKTVDSTVYAIIKADAFNNIEDNSMDKHKIISKLVQHGLKARLKESIPLVGTQYIELVFDTKHKAHIVKGDKYDIFPTITTPHKSSIMDNINELIAKLQKLPLENLLNAYTTLANENKKPIKSLVNNLNVAVKNLNHTITNLNKFTSQKEFTQLPKSLNNSLKEVEVTLRDLQRLTQEYGGDSKFADQLSITLKAVTEASKSFDKTNKMLDRNANALVVGDD
ncbi:MAG: MCE family protein [Epsilonproteobacteria bacterium]|nr:MCE family protein [Campylobacterota bacterium]